MIYEKKENARPLPGVDQSRFALQFEYLMHRYGLYLLLSIIIAALAGVFSGGYFSEARTSTGSNNLQIEYQLFGRWQTPQHLKITLHGQLAERQVLRIGHDYMDHFETTTLWPQPDEMYSEGSDLVLIYEAGKPREAFTVWLNTTPEKPGKAVTSVTLNNEPDIHFWQFIYP